MPVRLGAKWVRVQLCHTGSVLFGGMLRSVCLYSSAITHTVDADGFLMDGRRWKVNYADELDFKHFGWNWFEGRPLR